MEEVKFNRQIIDNPQDRCTQLIEDVQLRYGVTLTIRDYLGILRLPGGEPLFRQPSYHMHPYCLLERDRRSQFDKSCQAHCSLAVRRRCNKDAAPFVTNCWKGACEVVVPIWRNGQCVITIFAGVFRDPGGAHAPKKKAFTEDVRSAYYTLPEFDENFARELVRVLYTLGQGILHEADQLHVDPQAGNNRKQQIKAFVFNNAHCAIKLETLAQYLFLSPSRTSQVVRDLFGESFQDLVIKERIERAKHLLKTTTQNQEVIAERCGFNNAFYFSRVFKKVCGIPPGVYRKQASDD